MGVNYDNEEKEVGDTYDDPGYACYNKGKEVAIICDTTLMKMIRERDEDEKRRRYQWDSNEIRLG